EMTAYGDLDLSSITELPPGRRPIATRTFSAARRKDVLDRVRDSCAEGEQTAVQTFERLRAELSGISVGLLHGRLAPDEKAEVMRMFVAGRMHLLVCTTVIEVGVDVPNASLMIIESAERFGLAQLHQLRGRIGRGNRESTCILLFGAELTETARQRLEVIRNSNDGL